MNKKRFLRPHILVATVASSTRPSASPKASCAQNSIGRPRSRHRRLARRVIARLAPRQAQLEHSAPCRRCFSSSLLLWRRRQSAPSQRSPPSRSIHAQPARRRRLQQRRFAPLPTPSSPLPPHRLVARSSAACCRLRPHSDARQRLQSALCTSHRSPQLSAPLTLALSSPPHGYSAAHLFLRIGYLYALKFCLEFFKQARCF